MNACQASAISAHCGPFIKTSPSSSSALSLFFDSCLASTPFSSEASPSPSPFPRWRLPGESFSDKGGGKGGGGGRVSASGRKVPSNNEEALPPPKHLTYLLVLSPSSPEAAWEGGKGKWRRRRNEPEAPLSPSPQKVINRVPHIFRPLSLPATPMHAAELGHFAFLLPLPPRTARNSRNNFPRQEYPRRGRKIPYTPTYIYRNYFLPPPLLHASFYSYELCTLYRSRTSSHAGKVHGIFTEPSQTRA